MVGDVISGIVDGVGAIAQLVLESLGFAGQTLSEESKDGRRPVSWKRIVVGFLPLLLLVAFFAGWFAWFLWQEHCRNQTEKLVAEWVDKLSIEREPNGDVIRLPNVELPVWDAWNQPLQVSYENFAAADVVTVKSLGRDGTEGTRDDIEATKTVLQPKRVLRRAGEKLGNAVKSRLKSKGDRSEDEP